MRYHLFQKFFGKMVKIKETSFLLSKCLVSIAHHCICSVTGLELPIFLFTKAFFHNEVKLIFMIAFSNKQECFLTIHNS